MPGTAPLDEASPPATPPHNVLPGKSDVHSAAFIVERMEFSKKAQLVQLTLPGFDGVLTLGLAEDGGLESDRAHS